MKLTGRPGARKFRRRCKDPSEMDETIISLLLERLVAFDPRTKKLTITKKGEAAAC